MNQRLAGIYGMHLYYPLARISRAFRQVSRSIRGKVHKHVQKTSLPKCTLRDLGIASSMPRLTCLRKRNGNVSVAELAVVSALSAQCKGGTHLFEIGTFDGRTTLNFALNAPPHFKIATLDLPPHTASLHPVEAGERHMIDKEASGGLFSAARWTGKKEIIRIEQFYGDSAQFDFTPFHSRCALFFVDGSHSYPYARNDSAVALRCVCPGGWVVWHDYGVWSGVTRALDAMALELNLDLRHLDGTSLVVWRCLESDRGTV